jgi:transposase
MATRFVNVDRDTPLLLPPDLRDWVPADQLAHFILDAVDALDLRQVKVNTRGTGDAQYPPTMRLGRLIYSYATGTFGSRRIERSTFENIAVRLITADTHPDHDTICTFRRENQALLSESFGKVLQLAQALQLAQFGQITVSLDGTKIAANASKHAAVSYERAGQMLEQLEGEVRQLLAKAEQADATPRQDGLTIPGEIVRHRLKTSAGKALYKLRQQTVEPIFGIIKSTTGFRPFLLRGLEKVSLEWTLVTLAYNLKRLYHLGPVLKKA